MKHLLYRYGIVEYEVYDGDTVKVILDMGFDLPYGQIWKPKSKWPAVRIVNVDTPERTGSQKYAGIPVTEVVTKLLDSKREGMIVHSMRLGKYRRRFIGDFVWGDGEGDCLSNWLLDNQLAYPYGGKTKREWTDGDLEKVVGKCKVLMESI